MEGVPAGSYYEQFMYGYRAFGLSIRSDILIPEFIPDEHGDPDVTVTMCDSVPAGDTRSGPCVSASLQEAHFSWKGVGNYRVQDGRRIDVSPQEGIDPSIIRLPLIGVVFGALLQQRGLLVLHASTVCVDGRAVAIAGPKGHGKSTLAAALFRMGYPVLGDDVAAIDLGAEPQVHPAFPYLNVWPHAARSIGNDPDRLMPLRHGGVKRSLPVSKGFHDQAVPLARIYLLEFGSDLEVAATDPRESFVRLVPHCFSARYYGDMPETPAGLMASCGKLVRHVPIRRLIRRDAVRDVFRAAERVQSDVLSLKGDGELIHALA